MKGNVYRHHGIRSEAGGLANGLLIDDAQCRLLQRVEIGAKHPFTERQEFLLDIQSEIVPGLQKADRVIADSERAASKVDDAHVGGQFQHPTISREAIDASVATHPDGSVSALA